MEEFAFSCDIPERILKKYDIITCLKHTEERSVYLLKRISDGAHVLLKCGKGKSRLLLENEYNIVCNLLKEKDCDFVIKPIDYFEDNGYSYYLREYVKGSTLEMIVEMGSVFSEKEAVSITSVLCGIVEKLHKLNPPIICRDLNPSNILIADNGSIKIIDFDSAKQYDENAAHDAMCVGTKEMAAPEQFGFSQSDCRTDIYVLGMLLLYISTGSFDRSVQMPKRIRLIVAKSTEFNPKDRYSSVAKMKAALNKKITKKPLTKALVAVAVLCVVVLTCIFLPNMLRKEAVFTSPRIEQEVRRQLGKSENEKIYLDEAERIEYLLFSGDRVLESWEKLDELHGLLFNEYSEMEVPEELTMPLEDIAMLKGLKYLALDKQGITELPKLPDGLIGLSVKDNHLTDISAVAACKDLEYLDLAANFFIEDISCLEGLDKLRFVDLACLVCLKSIDPLRGKPLELLHINFTEVYDVPYLDEFSELERLLVGNINTDTIEKIGSLNKLKHLEFCQCEWLTELTPFCSLTGLESIILDTPNLCDINGISKMASLTSVSLSSPMIKELPEEISEMNIVVLTVTNCKIDDYSVLKNCESLGFLTVGPEYYDIASQQLQGTDIAIS